MTNLTSVGITAGVPTSGTGTVSTLDGIVSATGGPVGIAPASTPPSTAQPALVVAISPNSVNANGQAVMASSAPVVVASNQSAIPITAASLPLPTGAALETGGNLAAIVTNTGAALPTGNNVIGGVFGDVSIGGSDSTNPVKVGAVARNVEPSVLVSGQRATFYTDLVGKHVILPYSNPENFVSGTTSAITTTSSTPIIAAQAAGVRTYVTSFLVTNSHATVGTFVQILDGSTVIWQGWAAAAGGGFAGTFPVPLRGSTATALNAVCVTTGANVIVNVAGYKGV